MDLVLYTYKGLSSCQLFGKLVQVVQQRVQTERIFFQQLFFWDWSRSIRLNHCGGYTGCHGLNHCGRSSSCWWLNHCGKSCGCCKLNHCGGSGGCNWLNHCGWFSDCTGLNHCGCSGCNRLDVCVGFNSYNGLNHYCWSCRCDGLNRCGCEAITSTGNQNLKLHNKYTSTNNVIQKLSIAELFCILVG